MDDSKIHSKYVCLWEHGWRIEKSKEANMEDNSIMHHVNYKVGNE